MIVFVMPEKKPGMDGNKQCRSTHEEGESDCLILFNLEVDRGNLAGALIRDLLSGRVNQQVELS